jgi:hypothetical protein
MAKKNDEPEGTASIVDEIEKQLEEALSKRKAEVEKELEERIQREKEEAQKRLEEIDQELAEEKDALTNFKTLLAEFETSKSELKKQIKEHINKAIQFQTDIETLTGQTLEELKKVRELNQQFEELQQDTGKRVTELKDKLEDKFGIVAEVPDTELDETELNLDQELVKLKKIKDLLNNREPVDTGAEAEEMAPGEPAEGEKPSEEAEGEDVSDEETAGLEGEEVEEEKQEKQAEAEGVEGAEEEEPKEEAAEEGEQPEENAEAAGQEEQGEQKEQGEQGEQAAAGTESPELEARQPAEGEQAEEEAEGEKAESEESEEGRGEHTFQNTFERLEGYRKGTKNENDGEVSYFEHDDKIVLDGECLIATLNNSFEEAKKMYIKLSQTESPKDQFFIKQEIIKQQETLRKVMLRGIRLCEKENCSLPQFTEEILNLDVLKNILEKVSMENWSNQDDFASFDSYAKELKDAFYTRITPPAAYLDSIMKQLEIN